MNIAMLSAQRASKLSLHHSLLKRLKNVNDDFLLVLLPRANHFAPHNICLLNIKTTPNRMTFIADERFQSFYVENTGLWTLQIKYVQVRNDGFLS
jgi:hypothetical protein